MNNAISAAMVDQIVTPHCSCDGCGVCCMHMATPPFSEGEAQQLPPDVAAELVSLREARRMQLDVFGTDYIPCGWFDMVSRRCKQYEHRPKVCRDFEVGSFHCVNLRIEAGLRIDSGFGV